MTPELIEQKAIATDLNLWQERHKIALPHAALLDLLNIVKVRSGIKASEALSIAFESLPDRRFNLTRESLTRDQEHITTARKA